MQMALTSEQAAFDQEVRAFLAEALPAEIAERVKLGKAVGKELLGAWTRTLNEKGWAAPNWPKEYGGTGWSLVERHLFDVACRAAHAPQLSGFGFNMVGPAIIRYGSEAQKAAFLPKLLTGSAGRLAVLVEITLKVFPRAPASRTLRVENKLATAQKRAAKQ